jgi:MinD-like ATPase involved in chromosome partitioning or flagellar assembly
VELPTYTSIWRIEKRLYKLYDFRLPMPLPVGQIVVFTAITVPYVLLLTLFGLPFSHSLFWLYVLPPGVLTWLATRPVLESKRLPELVISQVRYLGEPASWCRMAPLAEKDDIVVTGHVWRRQEALPAAGPAAEPAAVPAAVPATAPAVQPAAAPAVGRPGKRAGRRRVPAAASGPATGLVRVPAAATATGRARGLRAPATAPGSGSVGPGAVPAAFGMPVPADVPAPGSAAAAAAQAPTAPAASTARPAPTAPPVVRGISSARRAAPARDARSAPGAPPARETSPPAREVPPGREAPARDAPPASGTPPARETLPPARGASPARETSSPARGASPARDAPPPARQVPARESAAPVRAAGEARPPAPEPPAPESPARDVPAAGGGRVPGPPPVVVVPAPRVQASPPTVRPRTVERAVGGPADQRSTNWRDHMVLVPGGAGPAGRPDHEKRDRARAVLPVDGGRLVAVVGCTVGAGQSVTTLVVADLLASLRGEAVAALDLNPGPASLAELAAPRPTLAVSSLSNGAANGRSDHAANGRPAHPGHLPRGHGQLDVFVPGVRGDGAVDMGDLEYRRMFDGVAARYQLTLADPGAAAVARVLSVADQLVLVAPASPDAARALAMTQEWLSSHGYDALTANSITVLNGLSKRSMPHAEQAEQLVRGRCRAIVRVPWDDHLAEPPAERGIRDSLDPSGATSRLRELRPPVLQAYTALAGVLIAALAASPQRRKAAR